MVKSGRWYAIVPVADREAFIDAGDKDSIAARPERFAELMGELAPEEERDVILQRISVARDNLRQRPASCANRQRREEAFDELYVLMADKFDTTADEVDARYRILDDYVFAELEYNRSKTCCWNSSNWQMYLTIMHYNEAYVRDETSGTCNQPVVFKARDGDFKLFADYAQTIGEGDSWVAWSADESCPAEDQMIDDIEVTPNWTAFCDIKDDVLQNTADSHEASAAAPRLP